MDAEPKIFPRARRASIVALGFVALVSSACARGDGVRPSPPAAAAPSASPLASTRSAPPGGSLLILTLDTTRRDFMGFLGHSPSLTPRLDELAAQSTIFEDAWTVAPLTLPAHASLMTGLYPLSHHLRDNGIATLPESAVTLAKTLREAGFATGASVASFVLDASFGLAQGFTTWHEPPREPGRAGLYMAELPADRMVDQALADLGRTKAPFFYWLHLFDAHFPYAAPGSVAHATHGTDEEHAETRRRYGEEIAFVDHEVGRLLDALRARPEFATLTIVVAADHGESLGDGREKTHGFFLYDPTVRIPLLIRQPGSPPHRVAAQVALVDVMPTVLDLLGVAHGELHFDGVTLADLVRGTSEEAPERTIALESWYGYANFGWAPLEACVVGPLKFQRAHERRLFDRAADPLERVNLWRADEPRGRALEIRLDALQARPAASLAPSGIELGADDVAKLAALGYLGARALDLGTRPDGALLDEPESHLDQILLLEQVNSALVAGRSDDAIRLARTLAQQMDGSVAAHEQLASLLLLQRTPEALDEAEKELRRSLALDFRRSKNHYNLGLVGMRRMGACDARARALHAANDLAGEQAAQTEAATRRREAIDAFRRALAIDSTHPEALANLANLLGQEVARLPAEAHAERVERLREVVDLFGRFLAVVPADHSDRARIETARADARKLLAEEGEK